MRLLADVHISPRTVDWLRSLGHDVVRVGEILTASAPDRAIVVEAIRDERVILTQDLDFSGLIAVSGRSKPSVISLRLSSSRVEAVNRRLEQVLPVIGEALLEGALVTVEDSFVRTRRIPIE